MGEEQLSVLTGSLPYFVLCQEFPCSAGGGNLLRHTPPFVQALEQARYEWKRQKNSHAGNPLFKQVFKDEPKQKPFWGLVLHTRQHLAHWDTLGCPHPG